MNTTTKRAPAGRAIGNSIIAGAAALALVLSGAGVANAATVVTGAQTGEWDLIAVDKSPLEVVNYDHNASDYRDVDAPNGWFAVGSGKVIDGTDPSTTAVGGGGIRIDQAFASATVNRTYTVRLTNIPAGTSVKVSDPANPATVYIDTAAGDYTHSVVLPAGATADFHEHYTWTFTSSSSQAQIGVKVTGNGLGTSGQTNSILFKF
ncbi:hypothetical protein ACH3VR_20920 [Microbacterium sp. B2969]|uniref:Uncharacterized protein n=1 Tax=Microbacterium alkaliflavum TaxID=3248839 RepID=A0ABW7QDW5_9MICO